MYIFVDFCPPFCVSELASEEAYGEAVLESPQEGNHGAKSEISRTKFDFRRSGGRPRPVRIFRWFVCHVNSTLRQIEKALLPS